jgi:hypothetical protein
MGISGRVEVQPHLLLPQNPRTCLSDVLSKQRNHYSSMAEVDIPVATEPIVQEPDKTALLLRLDELLEEYLGTLDRYQRAREQLSKHLSSVGRQQSPHSP